MGKVHLAKSVDKYDSVLRFSFSTLCINANVQNTHGRQLLHFVWQLKCQYVLQLRDYLIYYRKTNHFWLTTVYKKEMKKKNSIHIQRALIW